MNDKEIQIYAKKFLVSQVNKYQDRIDNAASLGYEEDFLEQQRVMYRFYHIKLAILEEIMALEEEMTLEKLT